MGATLTSSKRKATILPQVKGLLNAGRTQTEISAILGVHPDTIRAYQQEIADHAGLLTAFKSTLSDALHLDLLLGMQFKHKLLKSLGDEDVLAMSVADKRQFIRDLSVSNGTTYDKTRLQDGKSTSNTSHQIQLTQVHDSLYPPPTSSVSVAKPVADRKGNDGGIMQQDTVIDTQAIENTEIPEA